MREGRGASGAEFDDVDSVASLKVNGERIVLYDPGTEKLLA